MDVFTALSVRASAWARGGMSILVLGLSLVGCVSAPKYRMAPDETPRAQLLNVAFPASPLQASLTALIVYGGAGSWKREALWDEYVVTLHNPGEQLLIVMAGVLVDRNGAVIVPGIDPWKLEAESKARCREYDRTGDEFVRSAVPAVLTVGGIGAGTSALLAATSSGATVLQGPLAAVTVPSYVLGRLAANDEDRADIETEFNLRRFTFPLTLAPGQTRLGCLFFPMGPNPRTLGLRWSSGPEVGDCLLDLAILHGLHTKDSVLPGTMK